MSVETFAKSAGIFGKISRKYKEMMAWLEGKVKDRQDNTTILFVTGIMNYRA